MHPSSRSPLPQPRLGDRGAFPRLRARAYLNHAGISPPSLYVEDAVQGVLESYSARGVEAIGPELERRARLRAAAAAIVGAAPAQIALTFGATRTLVDLAVCIDWRPADRIIVFQGEFPANVTPWQQAAQASGCSVEMLSLAPFWGGSGDGLAQVEAALRRGGVRLVAVSAVQFQTGLQMPLAALAALTSAYGALLCVDAIQAAGLLPLDFASLGVDFLVTGAHKWLMGMEGAGFCAISARGMAALQPRVAGWLSHDDPVSFLMEGRGHLRYDRPLRSGPSFLESGAPNVLGHAALLAAIDPLLELGLPAIWAHVQAWNDAAEAVLLDRGFRSLRSPLLEQRSGVLAVDPPPGVDPVRLHAALNQAGLACALPDGRLRFAPHWPNALDEVGLLAEGLDAALSAVGGARPLAPAARFAPACARNRSPLLAALAALLPSEGRLLELASGTGEHAAFLARHLEGWTVQPSDRPGAPLDSAAAHQAWAGAPNLLPPRALDAEAADWGVEPLDAVLCVNMVHISPWESALGLLSGAARHLRPGGLLVLYGPFVVEGEPTAPSNLAFDADLRRRDPRWGLRALGALAAAAAERGLQLERRLQLPANNLVLSFRRDR